MSLGLYLHIPFCHSKCRYCDFCSHAAGEAEKEAFVAALCREIEGRAPLYRARRVDTVFFGGGTPTCLGTGQLTRLLDTLHRSFSFTPDAEWSMEINPATADLDKLRALREGGINRVSIGMQSADDGELALLGRAHRHADLLAAVHDTRVAGFENFNLDLMFGIPTQTPESFARSLDAALALAPTHLSVYSLQIEEGTPFFAERDTLALPDEESEDQMRAHLLAATETAGLLRYEISNFARAGYECRHNLRYWSRRDYLGLGPSAHSLVGVRRFYNASDVGAYLAAPLSCEREEALLTPYEAECEALMLGLRLTAGVDTAALSREFSFDFEEKYRPRLRRFLEARLVEYAGRRLRLTARGLTLSSYILSEILDL